MSGRFPALPIPPGEVMQIVIGGEAGQGAQLAGVVLAKAAASLGYRVCQSSLIGAAVHGGEAFAHVQISKQDIPYPLVTNPDLVVAMSQKIYDRVRNDWNGKPTVLYDSLIVTPTDGENPSQIGIPATAAVWRAFHCRMGTNMLLLGALSRLIDVVSLETLRTHIPSGSVKVRDLNLLALEMGQELIDSPSSAADVPPADSRYTIDENRCAASTAEINEDSADAGFPHICRICELACPDMAIQRDHPSNRVTIDANRCKACGLCAHLCPREAIRRRALPK